jgi:hypothetical protein
VKEAEYWKNKDTSKIKDFEVKVAESDWNFSTPYKGSIGFISQSCERLHQMYGLTLNSEVKDTEI